jgi:hypothetical protein
MGSAEELRKLASLWRKLLNLKGREIRSEISGGFGVSTPQTLNHVSLHVMRRAQTVERIRDWAAIAATPIYRIEQRGQSDGKGRFQRPLPRRCETGLFGPMRTLTCLLLAILFLMTIKPNVMATVIEMSIGLVASLLSAIRMRRVVPPDALSSSRQEHDNVSLAIPPPIHSLISQSLSII